MVMVVAHRGASAAYKENTLEAFDAARTHGAAGLELDVRRSADDVLVVHHDAHLADGRLISELAASELPDWLPTLAEVLDMAGDMWVNVEIKNLPDEPDYDAGETISLAVAGLVTSHLLGFETADDEAPSFADKLLVSSFNVDSLTKIRSVEPGIPLGLLVWGQVDPASTIARVEAHGFDAVNPQDLMVDQSFVDRARRAGLAINVWTVDDPRRMIALAEMGVDSIMTNDPALASVTLGEAGLLG
ncbi:MAG: glycerophosphodiester phosphodiesterase [Acidimicrobiia bacterium]|nr:glycerophosphodiester phosphodiesterase [Acidimicrobiia bacterium]